MLGFQVFHLGGVEQTQDAVDLVACSPSQDLMLVECTTGVLDPKKIANLISRATQVRTALLASSFGTARVVPILVTTKPYSEIAHSVAATERAGALVMSQEQIEEWVALSAAVPDADRIFVKAHQRLSDALQPDPGIITGAV